MNEILTFDSILTEGRGYKGKTVREVFNKDKGSIFYLIKTYHYQFSDDVLAEAHITKVIHDRKVYQEEYHAIRDKGLRGDNRKLKKDHKSLDEILDEMDDQRESIKEPNMDTKPKYEDDNNIVMPIEPEI